jgi:hypothetical protein
MSQPVVTLRTQSQVIAGWLRLAYPVDMPAPRMTDWTEDQLAMLRPRYPEWDLWAVRHATIRQTTWCARPAGTPVATINVDSPEALIAAIAEAERV